METKILPGAPNKVVYIAGPITGVAKYQEAFGNAADELHALGYIPLNPARLPEGMSKAQYMRICFAMIDCADAVLLLPGHGESEGAMLESNYCDYTGKPVVYLRNVNPSEIVQAWLKHDLTEVLEP